MTVVNRALQSLSCGLYMVRFTRNYCNFRVSCVSKDTHPSSSRHITHHSTSTHHITFMNWAPKSDNKVIWRLLTFFYLWGLNHWRLLWCLLAVSWREMLLLADHSAIPFWAECRAHFCPHTETLAHSYRWMAAGRNLHQTSWSGNYPTCCRLCHCELFLRLYVKPDNILRQKWKQKMPLFV